MEKGFPSSHLQQMLHINGTDILIIFDLIVQMETHQQEIR